MYSRFCALLDNYKPHQGYKNQSPSREAWRSWFYWGDLKKCYNQVLDATSQDYEDMKMLTSLWFDLCGRGGRSSSSSAFEHVFVGEIKEQRQGEIVVSGFHNWIQASSWLLVVLQHHNFFCFCIWMRLWWCWSLIWRFTWKNPMPIDYQGYIFPRRRGSWFYRPNKLVVHIS